MSLIPNPLNKFRSYNYRWSLGILSVGELNNPESYRNTGGNIVFIRSGGFPDKPVRTFIEEKLGINVEFFIDDVIIESLAGPNINTSTSSAVSFEFTVTEPYSIGLFFQTLVIAANMGGYTNYFEAPYVLSVDFIGHTDSDSIETIERKTFAVKLTYINLTADGSGSVYKVNAIAWNHMAFLDDYQNLEKTTVAYGTTVSEVLNVFTEELNKQEADKVKTGDKIVGNNFKVVFPLDIANNVTAGSRPNSVINSQPQSLLDATSNILNNFNSGWAAFGATAQAIKLTNQDRAVNAYNPDQNFIGNSIIAPDFNEFGRINFAPEVEVYDEAMQIIRDSTFSVDQNRRYYTFNQSTKIEKIIEAIILSSEWGKNLVSQTPDANNMITWFKIDAKTNILSTQEMLKNGRPAMEFEYRIVPYKMHYSVFSPPSENVDYSKNIGNSVKGYTYTYTGLNTDIINFEFTIDNSFYKPMVDFQTTLIATKSNAFTEQTPSFGYVRPEGPVSNNSSALPRQNVIPYRFETTGNGDTKILTDKKKLAEFFNVLVLNSDSDNVSIDLTIWGDPYYLSDSDAGNYRSNSSGPNLTSDNTIDFQRSEIDVLLSFNSAVDYKNNLMQLDPDTVFSGVYKIVTFTSNFSKGQFTQELKLLRRPGQTTETINLVNSLLGLTNAGSSNELVSSQLNDVSVNFDKIVNLLPDEFKKFTRLGQINIAAFPQLQPIISLVSQAQSLIDVGKSIQNNISGLLGQLQGKADGIQNIADDLQQQLTEPLLNASQILNGEIQQGAKKLIPPEIAATLREAQKAAEPFRTFVNPPRSASFPTPRTSTVQPTRVLPGDPTNTGGPR